ncbi:MAG: APC family permease [Solirubrobacteraceae bacterium]
MTGAIEESTSVAERVRSSVASNDPRHSLRRDSVRFLRTVALSVGIQGPTAGVIVGPAVLAGIVGGAGALAYLLALVAMSFVAYAFILFSRAFNSSSSVYAFNGSTLGARPGFVSIWLLLLVYVSFAAGVYASTADIAGGLLASLGVHVWWVWLAVVGWALTIVFAYVSFGLSSLVILACEGLAVVLITVVGIVVLARGGYHHHAFSTAPFRTHGIAFGVLGLGVVNAFGGFSGFEGAATLGEESARSQRTIPAAVAGSLVASAAVYIVFTWIVDNAYATPAALAADPAPLVHLATSYVGSTMGKLVNVAGVISAFGAQLACINAANRLLFSIGREIGDAQPPTRNLLVRTSARHGSPVGALLVTGALSLATLLAFSFERSPIRALTFIIQYGAYLILVVYLLTIIAALVLVWRRGRRPIPLVILTLGMLVLGYVLRDTFSPLPAGPFRAVALAATASVIVGIILALIPSVHGRLRSSALLNAARVR